MACVSWNFCYKTCHHIILCLKYRLSKIKSIISLKNFLFFLFIDYGHHHLMDTNSAHKSCDSDPVSFLYGKHIWFLTRRNKKQTLYTSVSIVTIIPDLFKYSNRRWYIKKMHVSINMNFYETISCIPLFFAGVIMYFLIMRSKRWIRLICVCN